MAGIKTTKRGAEKAAKVEASRGARFIAPWLILATLPLPGVLLHHAWGDAPTSAALAAVGIVLGAGAVAAMTAHVATRARPDNPVLLAHSVGTVLLCGGALLVMLIVGWTAWWGVYAVTGVVLVLTWNVRRFDIFRADEAAAAASGGVLAELGLNVRTKKVVHQTKDRADLRLLMGGGQTVDDVQKEARRLGSHAGTLRNGVTAIPGDREGEVFLSLEFTDLLTENLPWPGPTNPGGSIADGLHPGMYRDRQPVHWYPAGNYDKNIAPGHLAIAGMPRVGKGEFARVSIGELASRRDVVIIGSDTRKGDQFLGPLKGAVAWWVSNENGTRAMLKAFERAMVARAAKLGECGYSSWTPKAYDDPRLRMPAVVCWIEEAAAVLDDNARLITELGEASLSSGMFLVLSAQRWSADRVPTSLRTSVSNSACFGAGDDVSAGMVLRDSTLAAGPDPYEWGANHPGRFLMEANGVDPKRFPVPAKGYLPADDQLREVIARYAHQRAALDELTVEAFGEPYVKARANTPPVRGAAPVPTPSAAVETREEDTVDVCEDDDARPAYDEEYPKPTSGDEELDAALEAVDPREKIPTEGAGHVDMRPEPRPGERQLSPEERRTEFAAMLEQFASEGRYEVGIADLFDAWEERVGPSQANQSPFLYARINERIEQGQMERLDTGRGRYRIVALADVGHAR